MEPQKRSLGVYLLFSAAMVLAVFVRAYEPDAPLRNAAVPGNRSVSVRFADEDEAEKTDPSRRVVIPVKTHSEESAPLDKPTQFVSEKENPYSGSTVDEQQKTSWVQPDSEASSSDTARNPVEADTPAEPGESPGNGRETPEENSSVPVLDGPGTITSSPEKTSNPVKDAKTVTELSSSDQKIYEEKIRTFQELPAAHLPNSRLLVHFSNDGMVRLGTEAYKHADYFFNMVKKISRAWQVYFPVMQHYYGFLKEGEILVIFELDIDGELIKVEVAESYGQHILDRACVSAVREAAGFGPIPKEYREKGQLRVPFLFVYKRPEKTVPMYR